MTADRLEPTPEMVAAARAVFGANVEDTDADYTRILRAALAAQSPAEAQGDERGQFAAWQTKKGFSADWGWDAWRASAARFNVQPKHTVAPAVDSNVSRAAESWRALTETMIDAYLEDYEMVGEDEGGRDACYAPTEGERALIKDAIMGLLAEADSVGYMMAAAQAPAPAPEARRQAEPVAVLETPDGVIDLRAIAEQAGISMDCWDMGAASLAHSEGVHGVTREHLERFAALYGFACWNAALAANPPNMHGFVGRALDSLLQDPAVGEMKPAAWRYRTLAETDWTLTQIDPTGIGEVVEALYAHPPVQGSEQ